MALAEGDEWLLRPVLSGILPYLSLSDGTISLYDVAKLNDALDAKAENEFRVAEAQRKREGR